MREPVPPRPTAPPLGNDGTLTGGANFAAGHSGTGVAFDGLTGRVALLADLSPHLGGDSTVAFWINTTQAGNDDVFLAPGLIGIDAAGTANDVFWGWLDGDGHIGIQAGDSSRRDEREPHQRRAMALHNDDAECDFRSSEGLR